MKALILILILSACGAQPAPDFFNATRVDVMKNTRQYTVFYTEKRVEVIRLGYAKKSEREDIRADMEALIPRVTNCKTRENSIVGDSGEIRASITCPHA
ncbi:hypothetical protein [Cypionkella sp.]|uniref:hypothetical protein n=1 Tax=Cypionkella sp. TaxID=2811411 RepID=UPI0026185464|nr:hypothetical protein [Cypionkella sp.]MDB5665251.1 hypothetical protein [Cypionkella sp.]